MLSNLLIIGYVNQLLCSGIALYALFRGAPSELRRYLQFSAAFILIQITGDITALYGIKKPCLSPFFRLFNLPLQRYPLLQHPKHSKSQKSKSSDLYCLRCLICSQSIFLGKHLCESYNCLFHCKHEYYSQLPAFFLPDLFTRKGIFLGALPSVLDQLSESDHLCRKHGALSG